MIIPATKTKPFEVMLTLNLMVVDNNSSNNNNKLKKFLFI